MASNFFDHFQNIVDQVPGYIAYVNASTLRYEFVNKGYESLFGIPRSGIIGAHVKDIIGETNFRVAEKYIAEVKSGKPATYENVFDTPSGKHWIKVNFSPVFDDDGQVVTIALLNYDITERKLAEKALQNSESQLNHLFDNSPSAIAFAHKGVYLRVNDAYCAMFGYDKNEIIGSSILGVLSPESHDQARAMLKKREKGDITPLHFETKGMRKNGEVFDLEIESSICTIDGKDYSIAHHRDITARNRAAEEHLKFEQQLQQNQKLESLGILAGGIAHDFNNLMGGIFGYIDVASNVSKDEKVTRYLSKAMSTIGRARDLTGQLLTFAKGGAPVRQIGDLFPFVQETAQFALSGSNVSCNFDVQKDLWACNFDKNQIGQVIDNLIINAQQAMPVGGTIDLSARNIILAEKEHPLLVKGNYIKLSVQDSGVGIPHDHISRIFDPFFTTKAKGHGLGLATCYSIINRHGGCIDVDSEPGKGSSFHVYLPASMESVSSAQKKSAETHSGSGTILVMDDEEVMRDTIQAMLETLGYTVVCKENGKDAIDFFTAELNEKRSFSGMIFDLTVPGGMGGKAAIEEIRKTTKDIPVFVASGYADDPVMKNPVVHGFTASICKPFKISELSEILNTYLKVKE